MITFLLASAMHRNWKVEDFKKWVFVLLLGTLLSQCSGAKKKNKPVINYNSGVKVCSDPGSQNMMETSSLKPIRINETISKLEGDFETKQTIQDWKVVLLIEKMTPLGGKEVMLTHEIKDFCAELKRKHGDTIEAPYLRTINFTDCPIPPGPYSITNMIADTSMLPLNSMMEGEYYMTFTFYKMDKGKSSVIPLKKEQRIGCLTFTCVIEPAS